MFSFMFYFLKIRGMFLNSVIVRFSLLAYMRKQMLKLRICEFLLFMFRLSNENHCKFLHLNRKSAMAYNYVLFTFMFCLRTGFIKNFQKIIRKKHANDKKKYEKWVTLWLLLYSLRNFSNPFTAINNCYRQSLQINYYETNQAKSLSLKICSVFIEMEDSIC